MSVIADLIRAGVDPDLVAQVAQEMVDAARGSNAAQSSGARRQAAYRQRKAEKEASLVTSHNVTSITVTDGDAQGLPQVSPDGFPQRDIIKPLSLTPSSPIPNSVSARAREDFDQFWKAYPNKVGKPVAMKSFERIAKHDFAYSLEEILEGLDRYKRSIGDKPWLNPSTFLNQRRWEDQPAAAQPRAGPPQKPQTVTYATMLAKLKGYDQNDETSFDFNGKTIDADSVGNPPGPRFGKIAIGN